MWLMIKISQNTCTETSPHVPTTFKHILFWRDYRSLRGLRLSWMRKILSDFHLCTHVLCVLPTLFERHEPPPRVVVIYLSIYFIYIHKCENGSLCHACSLKLFNRSSWFFFSNKRKRHGAGFRYKCSLIKLISI